MPAPAGRPDFQALARLSTPWDETLLFAGTMGATSEERENFIKLLIEPNLPLAGRMAQIKGNAALHESFINDLRSRLWDRMVDEGAGLRARIDAGKALGDLGHPEFQPRDGKRPTYKAMAQH